MPFGLGRNRGGGGCLGRVAIGVVIAVIGLATYYFNTSVNPTTGEKQHIAMTANQEMALGLQAAPKMADQMGGAIDPKSSPQAAEVDRIGRRLVANTEAAKSPYAEAHNFHFYLLDDEKTVNAFALPGGQVFITKALYDKLENEGELAGVLGHEIGHVINRHSAEHMAEGKLGQTLVGAVAVGSSDNRGRGMMAAAAAAMANQMLQLKYSRGDETEADNYGLKYMTQAGFDPRDMLKVMEVLKQASGGGGRAEFMQTHPLPQSRIEDIKRWLSDHAADLKGRDLSGGARLP